VYIPFQSVQISELAILVINIWGVASLFYESATIEWQQQFSDISGIKKENEYGF